MNIDNLFPNIQKLYHFRILNSRVQSRVILLKWTKEKDLIASPAFFVSCLLNVKIYCIILYEILYTNLDSLSGENNKFMTGSDIYELFNDRYYFNTRTFCHPFF